VRGDRTSICNWFRTNGKATAWCKLQHELQLGSWLEKASETEELAEECEEYLC
jgi:hypothetical protein